MNRIVQITRTAGVSIIVLAFLLSGFISSFGTHGDWYVQALAWFLTVVTIICCMLALYRFNGGITEGDFSDKWLANFGEELLLSGAVILILACVAGVCGSMGLLAQHWMYGPGMILAMSAYSLLFSLYGLSMYVKYNQSSNTSLAGVYC